MTDRFDGRPAPSGCSTHDVISTLADPLAVVQFGETIVGDLVDALGAPVGPIF